MERDKTQYKATTVTKPIELKPKSVGSSGSRRVGIHQESERKPSHSEERTPEKAQAFGAVSILPVSRKKKTASKPEIVEQIGHRLASVYNDVLSQPIPDRFLVLLSELESGERQAPPAASVKKERK